VVVVVSQVAHIHISYQIAAVSNLIGLMDQAALRLYSLQCSRLLFACSLLCQMCILHLLSKGHQVTMIMMMMNCHQHTKKMPAAAAARIKLKSALMVTVKKEIINQQPPPQPPHLLQAKEGAALSLCIICAND